jgi:hypothetical protein
VHSARLRLRLALPLPRDRFVCVSRDRAVCGAC